MRVISGFARGKKLLHPPGTSEVRPTIDRVKEGLFSAIQFAVPGARILDLFAGSGQLGIECLSRGADFAVFIDQNRDCVDCVKQNLKTCGFFDKARVAIGDSASFLRRTDEKFDMVFLDPPYGQGLLEKVLPLLSDKLNPRGTVVFEQSGEEGQIEEISGLAFKKRYKYGKIYITIFEK